jgi:hypothetical protein
MDLALYRRHHPDCPGAAKGRDYKKCNCPVWCDGRIERQRVNKSMKTHDWDRAERKMLAESDPTAPGAKRYLLADAVEAYLTDCAARHLRANTVTSYKHTLDALVATGVKYCDQRRLDFWTGAGAPCSLALTSARYCSSETRRRSSSSMRSFSSGVSSITQFSGHLIGRLIAGD